jgi:hypothetical protein
MAMMSVHSRVRKPLQEGIVRLPWFAGLALTVAACGSPATPEGDPQLVGEIVRVGQGLWTADTDGPLQIHVKSDLNDECGIIFSIDDDTRIVDSRTGITKQSGLEILSQGAKVEVWFGWVLDSCPGQSHAEAVNRIE